MTTGLALALGVIVSGCQPADRWSIFEDKPIEEAVPVDRYGDALEPEPIEREDRDDVDVPTWPVAPEADEPWALSVEQAVMLALRRNRDLAVQQYEPVIAGTFQDLERGLFDPILFADIEHRQSRASEVSRATGERFETESDDQAGRIGLQQTLPTGTTLEPTFQHDRTDSDRTPEQHRVRLGLTLTQALLAGRSVFANLASIRQASLGTEASMYELRGFAEALVAETEAAYWEYALAERRIEIFEQSLTIAEQQRDEVMVRIEVGDLAETERPAVEAEVAERRQELIDAASAKEDRRLTLLRLLNPDGRSSFKRQIEPMLVDELPELDDVDVNDRVQLAQTYRPDLNEARLRLEQNRLETIVTRDGTLPRLDLFVSLGKTGFADRFTRAYRNLDENTYDFAVGANFTHALGNRAAQAADRAAFASRRQAAAAVENMRQIVELDVRRAMNDVDRTRRQIDASRATRTLREEALRAEDERFRVGESTAFQVAQAQRDLLASQIAELEAQLQYRLAIINLYLAEGTLLNRRGFTLPGTMARNGGR